MTWGDMIVPGCLLALLLPLGGAALGQWLDGSEGGLFGLAIGFGTQTLVKDCLSGFFLIVEGDIAVGDRVDIQGKVGTVERIVSFIGVGLLLMLVGYIAPMPPAAVGRVKESDA